MDFGMLDFGEVDASIGQYGPCDIATACWSAGLVKRKKEATTNRLWLSLVEKGGQVQGIQIRIEEPKS